MRPLHPALRPKAVALSVHVGAAGDYDPKTGKVEGAEDPCYFVNDPWGLQRYYCLHPERINPKNNRPQLVFPKAFVADEKAKQAAEQAEYGDQTGIAWYDKPVFGSLRTVEGWKEQALIVSPSKLLLEKIASYTTPKNMAIAGAVVFAGIKVL